MSDNDISLKISNEVIRPIVDAKIQAAIVAALGDGKSLIEAAVSQALKQKVNSRGVIGQYSSDNTYTYLEVMCGNLIRELTQQALKEWLENNRDKVFEAIKKEVAKDSKTLATVLINSLIDQIETNYTSRISVYFKDNR